MKEHHHSGAGRMKDRALQLFQNAKVSTQLSMPTLRKPVARARECSMANSVHGARHARSAVSAGGRFCRLPARANPAGRLVDQVICRRAECRRPERLRDCSYDEGIFAQMTMRRRQRLERPGRPGVGACPKIGPTILGRSSTSPSYWRGRVLHVDSKISSVLSSPLRVELSTRMKGTRRFNGTRMEKFSRLRAPDRYVPAMSRPSGTVRP